MNNWTDEIDVEDGGDVDQVEDDGDAQEAESAYPRHDDGQRSSQRDLSRRH